MAMEIDWQKSSYCMNASDCVELAMLQPGTVGVRDSKEGPSGSVLAFSAPGFAALISTIKQGELDLS